MQQGGRVCSPEGLPLESELELELSRPSDFVESSVSVADATGDEGDDYLKFEVTLSKSFEKEYVELYFKSTTEGTATEGVDYRKIDGWFVFVPGETSKEIWVPLIDDDIDDDGETGGCPAHRGAGGRSEELEGLRAPAHH